MGSGVIACGAALTKRTVRLAIYGPSALRNLRRLPQSAPQKWKLGQIHGYFDRYPLLCEISIPWNLITVPLWNGPAVSVEKTPHYLFVRKVVFGQADNGVYENYLRNQHCLDEKKIRDMKENFYRQVVQYEDNPFNINFNRRLLAKVTNEGNVRIIDGAHRAAIMSIINRPKDVRLDICACE